MNFILQILNGIQLGAIYALISLGYTMVYGIAQLINFAHGDIMTIAAYTAFFSLPVLVSAGVPIWVAVFPAMIICALFGMLIERIAYRPLRNSPRISNLITAIGISLLIQNVITKFIGSGAKSFPKVFHGGQISLGRLNIPVTLWINLTVAMVLTVLLQLFLKKTKYGKAMIAASQDYSAAKLMGINVDNIITLTFAIGSALAAVAAILYLSSYPQLSPTMGSMMGIKAFIAAVIGGIGIVPGAVIGGFIMGLMEAITRAYLPSQLSDAFVFGLLIIVLLVKPTGLLGKNVKEKV